MSAEYVLWALPAGESDRLHEKVMTSGSRARCEQVQPIAAADGWHGFRIVQLTKPDFSKVLA